MMNFFYFRCHQKQLFSYPLSIGVVACLCLLSGFTPSLLGQPSKLFFGTVVYAQEFKDQELRNYVKAAIDLDQLRLDTRQKIENINREDGVPPNIVCNEPDSLEGLTEHIRNLVLTFCNDSRTIIEREGLDVSRFNAIRKKYETDPEFKELIDRLFNEMRLQQS